MRHLLRNNGLSIVVFTIFLLLWAGQTLVGKSVYNGDRIDHHKPPVSLGAYLRSGHFLEATAENWESEFLQMGAFVWLTAMLYQKGSPESNDPDDPGEKTDHQSPPTTFARYPLLRALYSRSLTIALLSMFAVSFVLHAIGGAVQYNEEQAELNKPAISTIQFLCTDEFWFESLQNWQSEFLAIGMMIVLSIFLRHKGSAESKEVDSPNWAHE